MCFCMVGILDVLCSFHCQLLPTKQDLNTHQIWCLIRKALEQSWSRDVRRKGFHYLGLEKMEYKQEQWQDGRNAAERFQGVSNRELTGWSASLHLGMGGNKSAVQFAYEAVRWAKLPLIKVETARLRRCFWRKQNLLDEDWASPDWLFMTSWDSGRQPPKKAEDKS